MGYTKVLSVAIFIIVIFSTSLLNAWSLFGPFNKEDCILENQKYAKCEMAAKVIHHVCTCKYAKLADVCANYNKKSINCVLENIEAAQNEIAVKSIVASCQAKYK